MSKKYYILIGIIIIFAAVFFYWKGNQFSLPSGETVPFPETEDRVSQDNENIQQENESATGNKNMQLKSNREVFITDNVKHSIPLSEILSGGPPKDGIPSIDEPKFISQKSAEEFIDDESVGLGLIHNGETRFYPYQILVWHEIVNDTISGERVLVTYCPLCGTGIVFDPKVNGEEQEFGVSGKLWQSNLLMYNRTGDEDTESLWSQVLGEAVLGIETGLRLNIISSDTVKYGSWKEAHPETVVLSRDTGALRTYGADPYGDYYTSLGTIFATKGDDDDRLHSKELVIGIEIEGQFKAYRESTLLVGNTTDTFAGKTLRIEKNKTGEVRIFNTESGEEAFIIRGFWFSWVAVHPQTELQK